MNSRSAPQVAMSEAQLAARCPGCPRPPGPGRLVLPLRRC